MDKTSLNGPLSSDTTTTDAPDSDKSDQEVYLTAKSFNQAFTSRMKQYDKKMETLSNLIESLAQPKPPEEEMSKFKKQQAQIDQLLKERDQERQANLSQKLNSTTQDLLSNLGVKPSLIKPLMAQFQLEAIVKYDSEGQMVFQSEFGDIPLKEGLTQWSKTPDAKEFLQGVSLKGTADYTRKPNLQTKPEVYSDEDLAQAIHNSFYQ